MFQSRFHDHPTATAPTVDSMSPWGRVQHVHEVAEGIVFVSTAGHGGVWCSAEVLDRLPEAARSADGWYEEDCEAAIPMYFLRPEGTNVESCEAALRRYYPELLNLAVAKQYPDDRIEVYAIVDEDENVLAIEGEPFDENFLAGLHESCGKKLNVVLVVGSVVGSDHVRQYPE